MTVQELIDQLSALTKEERRSVVFAIYEDGYHVGLTHLVRTTFRARRQEPQRGVMIV